MGEKLSFTATIDDQNIVRIKADGKVISQKEIEGDKRRGSFTYKGEKIDWWVDSGVRWGNSTLLLYLYFYPINLNYEQNPVEVIRQ